MKNLILINALVWAAILLISAWLLNDHENYMYFFYLVVFAAGLMNSVIIKVSRRKNETHSLK